MSEDAKALMARADRYFESGYHERALDCYNSALGLTDADALLQVLYPKVAKTYAALNRYKEAITTYKHATRYVDPQKVIDIYIEIGRLYQSIRNYKEAVQNYRKALQRSSKPVFEGDVLYWIGESLYKMPGEEKNNESLKTLDEARSKPRNIIMAWEIHNTKGHALIQKKHFEEALQEFEHALNEDFDLIDIPGNIYNNKATCLAAMGKIEEAILCSQKAIEHSRSPLDTKAGAHCQIGMLKMLSDPYGAKEHLIEAKNLFETAENSNQISEKYANFHLARLNKHLDKINQALLQVDLATKVFSIDLETLKNHIVESSKSEILTQVSSSLIDEIAKVDQIGKIDAGSAIAKARTVIEAIITALYKEHVGSKPKKLYEMINTLHGRHVFPRKIYSYFETIRNVGNIGAHVASQRNENLTVFDVKLIGIITALITEWYITEE